MHIILSALLIFLTFIACPQAWALQPHLASYSMNMVSARNGSPVGGASGKMIFRFEDVCDAYTIEQKVNLNLFYAEGETIAIDSSSSSWESKNGDQYKFNTRRQSNGGESEIFRGNASIDNSQNGTAHYVLPETKAVSLIAGTMFPTKHTMQMLEDAKRGKKLFVATVFDGGDETGQNEISTFIGPAQAIADTSPWSVLKGKKIWPVRMAFFPNDSKAEEPDYEMSMQLAENGIAESLTLDYGDFVVAATLEKLELLPECASPLTKN